MYTHGIAFLIAILAAAPAVATDEPTMLLAVRNQVNGFNSADAKSAVATCADKASMIGDIPPLNCMGQEHVGSTSVISRPCGGEDGDGMDKWKHYLLRLKAREMAVKIHRRGGGKLEHQY